MDMIRKDIPLDIVAEILVLVPVKGLLQFRCVSKQWCSLIDSQDFIKSHLHQSNERKNNRSTLMLNNNDFSVYSLNLDSLDIAQKVFDQPLHPGEVGIGILGSCDGLFLLYTKSEKHIDLYQKRKEKRIVIWNPSTRKHHKLPRTELDCLNEMPPGYGLGYNSVSEDYKVVKIFHPKVEVYSLKSNSWKRTKNFKYYLQVGKKDSGDALHGVFLNGALHWVGYVNVDVNNEESSPDRVIIAFDLAKEESRIVPIPKFAEDDFYMEVAVLEGRLCIVANYIGARLEVWGLKEYGVEESWIKLFSTEELRLLFLRPLSYSKDGREVLLQQERRKLFWFDIEHNAVKKTKVLGCLGHEFETEVFVQSLVPVGGGGNLNRKRKRPEKPEKEGHIKDCAG